MATTISTGFANSPKKLANIADHGVIYGGRGLVFDGVVDYLDTGDPLQSVWQSPFTVSLWAKPDDGQPAADEYLCGLANTDGDDRFYILIKDDGFLQVRYKSANVESNYAKTNLSVLANGQETWRHFVVTIDTSLIKIYLDGELQVLEGSKDGGMGIAVMSAFETTYNLWIGDNNDVGTSSGPFAGVMSDFKIFNTVLTEAQIQELYLKPEQSAPLAVRDNLVAWYPMCEGNPDSPQSVVYDMSEKGLGSEQLPNPNFEDVSSGTTLSGWSIAYGSGERVSDYVHSGSYSGRLHTPTSSGHRFEEGLSGLIVGGTYKVTVYIRTIVKATAYARLGGVLHNDGTDVFATVASETDWEKLEGYITVDGASKNMYVFSGSNGSDSADIRVDSASVKLVKMGNHATTVFYGDELLTNTTFDNITGWAPGGGNTVHPDADSGTLRFRDGGYAHGNGNLFSIVAGKTYRVSFEVTEVTNALDGVRTVFRSTSGDQSGSFKTTVGTQTDDFVALDTVANASILLYAYGLANLEMRVDNPTVKEIGVSTAGYDTADGEQTIPQVPLMRYNEKMVFDGYDDKVSISDTSALDISSAITISTWIRPNGVSGFQRIIDKAGAYELFLDNDEVELETNDDSTCTTTSPITANKWHHVVATYDSTTAKIYVNGVLGITDTPGSGALDNGGTDLFIGTRSTSAQWFTGLIEEVSLFNTALSATEVQELFNDGVALDATTHSKKGNLVGYWRNDGISSWNDRRGWSYLDFDGSGDYVTISDNSTLDITGNITIATWFMLGAVGADQELINKLESGVSSGYRLMSSSSNKLQGDVKGDGSGSDSSSTSLVVGTWYHGAMTWDGSSVQVYLNGSADGSPTSYSGTLVANNQPLYLGARYGSGNYLTGGIAQTGIWNIALTASQIESMFNEGLTSTWTTNYSTGLQAYLKHDSASSLTDLSSNTNTGTVTNATLNDGNDGTPAGSPESIVVREGLNADKDGLGFPLKNADKNVLRLDGASEYVDINYPKSSIFDTGSGSLECWVKTATNSTTIICSADEGATNGGFIELEVSGGKMAFIHRPVSSGSTNEVNGSTTITDDVWHHLVVVSSGTAYTFYLDGASETIASGTNNGAWFSDVTDERDNLMVGARTANRGSVTTDRYFKGLVDEVRIYSQPLSPAEVTKNYKHGKGKHS